MILHLEQHLKFIAHSARIKTTALFLKNYSVSYRNPYIPITVGDRFKLLLVFLGSEEELPLQFGPSNIYIFCSLHYLTDLSLHNASSSPCKDCRNLQMVRFFCHSSHHLLVPLPLLFLLNSQPNEHLWF